MNNYSAVLKIAFLIEAPGISGGTNVIFNHAVYLKSHGHHVVFVTKSPVKKQDIAWFPQISNFLWETYENIFSMSFDIAISTYWATCANLHLVRAEKYVYFIQSIESRFYSEESMKSLVDSTYDLPIYKVTIATWMKDFLEARGESGIYLCLNGVDKKNLFYPGTSIEKKPTDHLRLLIEGPLQLSFKNVPEAISLARKAGIDDIWLLTSTPLDSYPGVKRVFSKVPIDKTGEIYRSCHAILKMSTIEGMFGPPLEMFHCGGTAVVYAVTGYDEYIKHSQNALVAQLGDKTTILDYLLFLSSNLQEVQRLSENALRTAEEWPSWQTSSAKFTNILQRIAEDNSLDKDFAHSHLKMYSDKFNLLHKGQAKFWELSKNILLSNPSIASFSRFILKKMRSLGLRL